MTFVESKQTHKKFVEELVAVHGAKIGKPPAEANSHAAIAKRETDYAAVVERQLQGVPAVDVLNKMVRRGDFNEKLKSKMLCHVADILFRSKLDVANELNLTINDIVYIAIGVQLRYLETEKNRKKPVLSYIPDMLLPKEEKDEIAHRFAEYILQFNPGYTADKSEKLTQVLCYNISDTTNSESMKNFAKTLGIESPSPIILRLDAFKSAENKALAIMHPGAKIEASLDAATNGQPLTSVYGDTVGLNYTRSTGAPLV